MLLDDLRLFEVCHEIWKTSIVNLNVENAFVNVFFKSEKLEIRMMFSSYNI